MFQSTLTRLAALNVSGVSANYSINTLPETLSRGQLPVLLVLPSEVDYGQQRKLFQERGSGFESLAFSSGARTVTYAVTHLLLVAPVASGAGMRQHLPVLIDLIDAYFAALSADITLGGHLLEPARVDVEPGIFTYGGTDYHGCAFRHLWVVQA